MTRKMEHLAGCQWDSVLELFVCDPRCPILTAQRDPARGFRAPHCDSRVLHRFSTCEYCDMFPELQKLRELWSINYTGETDPKKVSCPADAARGVGKAHQWGGNMPLPKEEDEYL